jgi:formate hydrogenlyase subunit 3/multisubunit Na+/H+ antiporter MnhD subunit
LPKPNNFEPTQEWLMSYWLPYGLQYIGLSFVFLLISRSWRHFLPLFLFFCVSGQDLFFFGWGGFIYPVGEWNWMQGYRIFGTWTTIHQFFLSFLSIIGAVAIVYGVNYIGKNNAYLARKLR